MPGRVAVRAEPRHSGTRGRDWRAIAGADDMVALRVSPDHRPAIVGAPGYFESHPTPKSPRDLVKHRCINFRHGTDEVYRWEFEKGTQSVTVAVDGPLVVDDVELVLRAA